MPSDNNSDIPQIAVVGERDDNSSGTTLDTPPTTSLNNTTVLRNNNPEEHDGLSFLGPLAPPSQGHRRKGSMGGSSTDCDMEDSSRFWFRLVRSGRSSIAGFFKRILQCVRHPSSSPTGDIEMDFDTALDLKQQEADLNVAPFTFKQRQLTSLVDSKSLENLENLGGVQGLLRGLGTNPLHGLNTNRTPPSQLGSPHPRSNIEMSPLNLVTSPAGLHESTASLGADPGVGRPVLSAYEATVEDRRRIYGHNIRPQPPSKTLLRLIWLALQDKVIALLSIAAVVLLVLGLFQDFGTTHPAEEPSMHWVEGVAIIAAVLIVVSVGSLNDWQNSHI